MSGLGKPGANEDVPDVRPLSTLTGGGPLKFWTVYPYLVVYDPASEPLTIVAVLHGARDVEQLLKDM